MYLWKTRNLQHVLDNKGHCLNIVVIDGLSVYLSIAYVRCEFKQCKYCSDKIGSKLLDKRK